MAAPAPSFHGGSHHQDDPADGIKRFADLNRYHVSTMAYFAEKLKATPDGDGTLLDHSLILYGTNMGNSNQHQHYDVAHLLVGGANGKLKGGRHLAYDRKTVTTGNLLLSVLDMYGIQKDKQGDSTGSWRSCNRRELRSSEVAGESRPLSLTDRGDATDGSTSVVCCAALLVVPGGDHAAGAGSEVADAVMKGDTDGRPQAASAEGRCERRRRWTARRRCIGPSIGTIWKWPMLLIRAGANVKAVNRDGMTPLSWPPSMATRR